MDSIPQFTSQEELKLLNWFHNSGGILSEKCGISQFTAMGRGFIARTEIEKDELLFSIPRHLLLNLSTSQLSNICRDSDQDQFSNQSKSSDVVMIDIHSQDPDPDGEGEPLTWDLIHKKGGWAALIISAMWENWRVSEQGRLNWQRYNRDRMDPWTNSDDKDEILDGQEKMMRFREIERPKGNQEWKPYLDLLPRSYDTPIFWNEEELKELEGTNVIDKVGRTEMDQTYYDLVLPYVQSRPLIFFGSPSYSNSNSSDENSREEIIKEFYSLEMYHRMGSAILSRSFHVEKPGDDDDDDAEETQDQDQGNDTLETQEEEDVGEEEVIEQEIEAEESDDEEEDSDREQLEDISLTPMADLLNAKYESDNVSKPRAAGISLFGGNPSRAILELHRAERDGGKEARARLFYKALTLEMRATKPISKGEQIFNTYGNPPNSDLLRRYSHVDEPNGNDIVELSTENLLRGVIDCLSSKSQSQPSNIGISDLRKRLEWAYEYSLLDDTFILTYPFQPSNVEPFLTGTETEGKFSNKDYRKACKIDDEKEGGKISSELLQASKLLLMNQENYQKVQKKLNLGKAEIDSTEIISIPRTSREVEVSIAEMITFAIKDRMKTYTSSLEDDEKSLYGIGNGDDLQKLEVRNEKDEKKRKSLVVRVGEKRILRDNLLLFDFVKKEVEKEIEKKERKKSKSKDEKKKRAGETNGSSSKRRKA